MWIEPKGFAEVHTRGNTEAHRLQDPSKWVPFGVGAIEGQSRDGAARSSSRAAADDGARVRARRGATPARGRTDGVGPRGTALARPSSQRDAARVAVARVVSGDAPPDLLRLGHRRRHGARAVGDRRRPRRARRVPALDAGRARLVDRRPSLFAAAVGLLDVRPGRADLGPADGRASGSAASTLLSLVVTAAAPDRVRLRARDLAGHGLLRVPRRVSAAAWSRASSGRPSPTAGSSRTAASSSASSGRAPAPDSSSSSRSSRRSRSLGLARRRRRHGGDRAAPDRPGRPLAARRPRRCRRRGRAAPRRARRSPRRPGRIPGVMRRAVRSADFWFLASTFFVCGATSNGLIGQHFISHAVDHGFTARSRPRGRWR